MMVPVSMLTDAQLVEERRVMEDKLKTANKLTQAEAIYLDAVVDEQNRRQNGRAVYR